MMIFLSIFFILYSFYWVVNPSKLTNYVIGIEEETLQMRENGKTQKIVTEFYLEKIIPILFLILVYLIDLIYMINAISIDIYQYPTLIAICYFVGCIGYTFIKRDGYNILTSDIDDIKFSIRKKKEKINKLKTKLRTIFFSILWIIYYGYIFYILVFIK